MGFEKAENPKWQYFVRGLVRGLCLLSLQLLQSEAWLLVTGRQMDKWTARQQADREVVASWWWCCGERSLFRQNSEAGRLLECPCVAVLWAWVSLRVKWKILDALGSTSLCRTLFLHAAPPTPRFGTGALEGRGGGNVEGARLQFCLIFTVR